MAGQKTALLVSDTFRARGQQALSHLLVLGQSSSGVPMGRWGHTHKNTRTHWPQVYASASLWAGGLQKQLKVAHLAVCGPGASEINVFPRHTTPPPRHTTPHHATPCHASPHHTTQHTAHTTHHTPHTTHHTTPLHHTAHHTTTPHRTHHPKVPQWPVY